MTEATLPLSTDAQARDTAARAQLNSPPAVDAMAVTSSVSIVERVHLEPEVEASRTGMLAQMSALVEVLNDEQANLASALVADMKAMCRQIDEFFDPIKKPVHAAWKDLCNRQAAAKADLESESARLQRSLDDYLTEKRRIENERREQERREQQRLAEEAAEQERQRLEAARLQEATRLEAEAKAKREEADRMAAEAAELDAQREAKAERIAAEAIKAQEEAAALIESGDVEAGQALMEEAAKSADKAVSLMDAPSATQDAERLKREAEESAQASEEMLTRSIDVPVPVVPVVVSAPVKSNSVATDLGIKGREQWDFEIVDAALIPREYLVPDMAAIRGVVKAMKGKTNIPGIQVTSSVKSAIGARKK